MAWEIGAAIQAQHAQVLSAGSEWPYGFSLDQIGSSDDSTQLIPMVNHRLHGEEIRSINVYCSGSVPELAFSANRNAKGFKAAALSDLQVLTLGIDGRFRQVMLQFPARVNTAIEFPSRRTPVGAAFWFYGTCVFSEADKGLRLQHEPLLSAPRDPWIRSAVEAGGHAPLLGAPVADDKQAWNQGLERPSLYAVKLEVPTLQLSVSDMHPYVAIAKSDGELVIANMCVYDLVRGSVPHSRSLYALFCAPDAGEESRFVYKRRAAIEARPRGNKRSSSLYNLSMPQVSVLACAWSRNPRTFAWIASASANGVLRIESAAP
ncbi:hypothetical protein IWW50_006133 [Coemansia erecta]|nr:hypothetical protein GGF43_005736 [Coemansia sp. RSA 2618]KAJ2817543.1 hypothetical protein IWW50_006133 [Coemansia erecta]